MMSVNDIFEWFLIAIFVALYLLHCVVMGSVHRKYGGLRNRRLIIYTVVSILPLILSAVLLLFGPDDLVGRRELREFHWVVIGYLILTFLFCMIFLFASLSELTRNTRIMVVLTTIIAVVISWLAFLGSVFATV